MLRGPEVTFPWKIVELRPSIRSQTVFWGCSMGRQFRDVGRIGVENVGGSMVTVAKTVE